MTDLGAWGAPERISLNLIGAIIQPWRGVLSARSADRTSRSLDRYTGNSPCLRRVILGKPSRPTRPIRANRPTPARAPPSVPRFRSIRCVRLTRPRPVRIRRKSFPEAPRLEGQRSGKSSCEPSPCSPRRRRTRSVRGCCGNIGLRRRRAEPLKNRGRLRRQSTRGTTARRGPKR